MKCILVAAFVACLCASALAMWVDVAHSELSRRGVDSNLPVFGAQGRLVALSDWEAFRRPVMSRSDALHPTEMRELSGTIDLPLPTGGSIPARLFEYAVRADASDDVRTFMLRGVKSDLTGSLTWAHGRAYASFRASEVENGEHIVVDPMLHHAPSKQLVEEDAAKSVYVAYRKSTYPAVQKFTCHVDEHRDLATEARAVARGESASHSTRASNNPAAIPGLSSFGSDRRTLTLALAATAQYGVAVTSLATNDPNFVAMTSAAQVVALNRVNEVYLASFALTMQLVSNNEVLISTNSSDLISNLDSDPYTLIDTVSTWCTNKGIASTTYSIGHVFTTGGGGLAGLGVACSASTTSRARGVTGLPNPVGDPFYIDFVAHEMGHQYDGQHTFNSQTGNCNGNRAAGAAVEVGSGITIQAYAGICGADDLASNSIPQFAWFSLSEMSNSIQTQCAAGTVNAGGVTITDLSENFTIPSGSAFLVYARASTTSSGASVKYSFEDAALGVAASLAQGDLTSNPLFRTYLANGYPQRVVQPNGAIPGMIAATTDRYVWFRLAAYDTNIDGGHFAISNPIRITVDLSASAMTISTPAASASVAAGASQSFAWDTGLSESISSNVCVYVVDSTDDTGGAGYCIGTMTNNGSGSLTIPADVASGAGSIRLSGELPNLFHTTVAVTFTGGGAGLHVDNCPASCYSAGTSLSGSTTTTTGGSTTDSNSNSGANELAMVGQEWF